MSRLTPLEIQKHRFSRKWKGLDPTEVGAFLDMAAEEMEALARENASLQGRIRGLEEENAEHRDRERVLKDTLLSAQRASDDIRGAAQTKAELMVQEAEDAAERLTHNAMQRAAEIEKAIHDLKLQRASFRLEIQKMIELFQQALEMDRKQDEQERPLSYLRRNPG
ncbi:MAG TPA: DivIVA domain-containing protein [Thermoanaerobaculia bacterium]|jgi:cell division initiation protein|nr:DivIVA domain-containing protein [Thermoanaerobaculia bacterium]